MAHTRKIKEMLMTAIFEVFERGFFVFAEPVREADADYRIRADIEFRGPIEGALKIFMSDELAHVMVKNMLSLDDDQVTKPVIEDCVKECINMICGSFVRRVDPDHVFDLAIPGFERILHPNGDREGQSDSCIRLVFDTEAGAFEVMMTASGCP
jgi:CheY-specific phosphatase CheX